ncbi:restriction endonuclease subunit S [Caldicellulosiruptor acetigenus]|uniref:Restriction modification system DNA specificity domain-containing protein n=1 Tax=Caldicellulosiruptor acetigenus 6A TaxID=632516 RepID=G2PTN8_9FIRM|nr:restriction endonuclease subunit S [Caldicellulosiruptor acetigenus]AEM74319.1 restriction modification system DNA specificity domain-containing protein [Caldicellulosiruptor acetigenus 6A]
MANNAEFPKEWTIVSLERDCVLISGLRPKGGASDEGIPSLGGEHITLDGRINFSDVNAKYVPEKFFKIMTKGKAEENDILVNKDGANTGKVAILKKKFYKDIAINEHLFILRSKKLFVQQYLFYWFFSRFGQKQITDRITGSAQPGLSSTFIKNFLVPRPPLPEQRKIAEILETIDNAIEKTDAIIEKYKRIKQGLMQDLLTKGVVSEGEGESESKSESEGESEKWRLRDEKIDKFKDSPLGRIPEEWEVRHISDISLINPKTTVNPRESYPYIEMDATPIMGKRYKYITYRKASEAGVKFKKGDVLIARITPCAENGKALLVPNDIHIGIGSTEFIVFRAKENVDNVYLFYLLISDLVRNVSIGLMEGTSGRQRIPKYVYSDIIKVAIPKSKTEQQRVASILSQIDEVIEKEQAYKEKLERIKKGLMEDLLTGKVRVNHLIEEE